MDKKKLLWNLLFLAIALLSIWAVAAQNRNFSFREFGESILQASPVGMAAAVACMLGFIVFPAMALLRLVKGLGYKAKFSRGMVYAAADIYFSAITPSATGGQPASAYFMIKDGIPGVAVTVALLVNLVMYSLALLSIGLLGMIVRPRIFLQFGWLSRLFILIGLAALLLLAIVFYMLVAKDQLLYHICDKALALLERMHLIRNGDAKRQKLKRKMADYQNCTRMLSGQRRLLVGVYFLNLVQRISQITVTLMVFLATGGDRSKALEVWVTQAFTAVGTYSVPIPGGMGVADYLLLDGFGGMMSETMATNLELISRSLSFYCCILFSAIIVIAGYITTKKRSGR